MPKYSISEAFASIPLTDLKIDKSVAPQLNRKQRRAAAKLIRLTLFRDKSGTYAARVGEGDSAQQGLIDRFMTNPLLAAITVLNIIEMSGLVASSGYRPISEAVAPGIMAGSTSPFAEMFRKGMADDVADLAARAEKDGIITIHVVLGDLFSSDDVVGLLPAYHQHQREHAGGTHVFVVKLGEPINHEVADALSVHHQPFQSSDRAYDQIFDLIYQLVKSVSQDITKLGGIKSIDLVDMPANSDGATGA